MVRGGGGDRQSRHGCIIGPTRERASRLPGGLVLICITSVGRQQRREGRASWTCCKVHSHSVTWIMYPEPSGTIDEIAERVFEAKDTMRRWFKDRLDLDATVMDKEAPPCTPMGSGLTSQPTRGEGRLGVGHCPRPPQGPPRRHHPQQQRKPPRQRQQEPTKRQVRSMGGAGVCFAHAYMDGGRQRGLRLSRVRGGEEMPIQTKSVRRRVGEQDSSLIVWHNHRSC